MHCQFPEKLRFNYLAGKLEIYHCTIGILGGIRTLYPRLSEAIDSIINERTGDDVWEYVHYITLNVEEGSDIDPEIKSYVENPTANLKEDLLAALGRVTAVLSCNSVKLRLIDNMYALLVKYSNGIFKEVMDNPKVNEYTFWDACTRGEAFESLGISE